MIKLDPGCMLVTLFRYQMEDLLGYPVIFCTHFFNTLIICVKSALIESDTRNSNIFINYRNLNIECTCSIRFTLLVSLFLGSWHSDNCGERKSYVCKKEKGSDSPISPDPTDPPEGYCPEGWFGFGW